MKPNVVPISLRERLGPEATSGLVDLMNDAAVQWKSDVIGTVGDRFERRLVEETSKLRIEMVQGFAGVRDEFAALRREMSAERFELLKWSFLFWTGQFFASAGLMLVLIRFLKPGG